MGEDGLMEPKEDDEIRRRFREAMARKEGKRLGGTAGHENDKKAAPVSNAKAQRMFRRKSGG